MASNQKIVEVFIEISKNSRIKYEYDKERNALVCDRVLHTPFSYNFNYGFIPNTLSEDGDPIDVVVLMDDELVPGSYIKCIILGCLETSDDKGDDPKLIACPCSKVDPTYTFSDIADVSPHTIEKIRYFFQHYKDLENKNVNVGNFLNSEQAYQILNKSIDSYETFSTFAHLKCAK